mgnify:FL=1
MNKKKSFETIIFMERFIEDLEDLRQQEWECIMFHSEILKTNEKFLELISLFEQTLKK